jgi:hypothetical protein
MKKLTPHQCLVAGFLCLVTLTLTAPAQSVNQPSEPIPESELGARAGAQYQGDGLSVVPLPEGARLRCVFQKLEGQVAREGLWLVSTVEPQIGEKFRVAALDLYLKGLAAPLPFFPRSSFAYAIGPGPKTVKTAEDLAWQAWEGNPDDEFGQGEMEDPYFSLCFRNHPDPLGKPFQQLASAVARPLLNSQTEL